MIPCSACLGVVPVDADGIPKVTIVVEGGELAGAYPVCDHLCAFRLGFRHGVVRRISRSTPEPETAPS